MSLVNKHVVVGIGGGVAAYKAVYLVRELVRRGAEVRVVMTASATRFVGPITLAGLTGHPPVTDLWDPGYSGEVHVELGVWADAIVVAPATMNLLARAAAGLADDPVLATLACAQGPVLFAPAMHERMWRQPATQRATEALRSDGVLFVGPIEGELASGEVGVGRMCEPELIATAVESAVSTVDLSGLSLLATAGPTLEDLDPVRFLGNRSSGRMGFAIAERAAARGATVTLVSGPVDLATPARVQRIDVRSAVAMHGAVLERAPHADVVVMAAAVADYRPAETASEKIKKNDGPRTLELVRNPDILADLGDQRGPKPRPLLIGFAVETSDLLKRATDKRSRKRCDLMVANQARDGFGGEDNQVILVDPEAHESLPRLSKRDLADRLLDRVTLLLETRDARTRG